MGHVAAVTDDFSSCLSALQAAGPPEGVVGVPGRVVGSGLDAEGGAERLPAGKDPPGGGTEHPEGSTPKSGP